MLDFDYNATQWDPPAPAINIQLGRLTDDPHERLLALLDTGADMTVLPPSLIGDLALLQVDEVRYTAFVGDKKELRTSPVYSAHIILGGALPARNVRVMEHQFSEGDRYIIIGRDILNDWLAELDGPGLAGKLATASDRFAPRSNPT